MANPWLHFLFVLVTLHISNSDSVLNDTHSNGSALNGTHRIIKRYTQRFPFPKPRLPTLPRPQFPLFPVFGHPPPPGHGATGNRPFPKIRLRLPSDENLFTEEEDEEEEVPKKKKRKKQKGNKKAQSKPQSQFDSQSESAEAAQNPEHLKGESGELPKSKGKGKRRTTTTSTTPGTTESPPPPQEDRTLLAAKNALLFKKAIIAKAIILKKLKKKKKKAALAYGLTKVGKVKGVSVKAPGLVFSVGRPSQEVNAKVEDEDAEAYIGEFLEDDDEDEDEDGDGEKDDDDDPDTDPNTVTDTETDAIVIKPAALTGTDNMTMDSSSATMKPQTMMQMQQYTNSMMQQLQEQLQQKQQMQQQIMTSAQQAQFNNQSPEDMSPKPELYQPQMQMQPGSGQLQQYAQQGQAVHQQQPGITVDIILPTSSPEVVEEYKGGSKASKKAKKKKKGKPRPRPVNLGVKANLYKQFDKLAKKAQNKLSTFIQVDVDLYRGLPGLPGLSSFTRRTATEDAKGTKNQDKFASRTLEISSGEEESDEQESIEREHVHRFRSPENISPPPSSWAPPPSWSSEYPKRKETERRDCGVDRHCRLKPVWVVFNNGPVVTSDVL